MSKLWDPIFGRSAVTEATSDQAWLQALCDVEAALARACSQAGLVDARVAEQVVRACDLTASAGVDELGVEAAAGGNPVIPLVARIRASAGPSAAHGVHLGATSQDILDTASMLVAANCIDLVLASLTGAAQSCVGLVREHQETAMVGRTLLQAAVPTTFGAVVAGWGAGLERSARALRRVRSELAVQLGGAAGTLAGWYPAGAQVRAMLAAELGLGDPHVVWHAERSRICELAGALGATCAAVANVATDIVLLAQSELGEVGEQAPGGSSTMAHKQNPIAAVTARAAAGQAPGLVATLLASAGSDELQRAAGSWHAEWPALDALLRTACGATNRLQVSLAGLQVRPEAMAANMQRVNSSGADVHLMAASAVALQYLEEHSR